MLFICIFSQLITLFCLCYCVDKKKCMQHRYKEMRTVQRPSKRFNCRDTSATQVTLVFVNNEKYG